MLATLHDVCAVPVLFWNVPTRTEEEAVEEREHAAAEGVELSWTAK